MHGHRDDIPHGAVLDLGDFVHGAPGDQADAVQFAAVGQQCIKLCQGTGGKHAVDGGNTGIHEVGTVEVQKHGAFGHQGRNGLVQVDSGDLQAGGHRLQHQFLASILGTHGIGILATDALNQL